MVIFLEPLIPDALDESSLDAFGPHAQNRMAMVTMKADEIHTLDGFCRFDFIWLSSVYGVKAFGKQPKESTGCPVPIDLIRLDSSAS